MLVCLHTSSINSYCIMRTSYSKVRFINTFRSFKDTLNNAKQLYLTLVQSPPEVPIHSMVEMLWKHKLINKVIIILLLVLNSQMHSGIFYITIKRTHHLFVNNILTHQRGVRGIVQATVQPPAQPTCAVGGVRN